MCTRRRNVTDVYGVLAFSTNGIQFYLHDGRARTIEEAILWHNSEAATAKNKFIH